MVHAKNEYQMIYTGCPKITIHCHLFLFFVSDIIRRDVKSSEFDSLGLAAFQVYHSLVHGLPIDVTIIQHDRQAGSFFSTCLQLSECFWSFMAVKLLQRVAQFTLSKVSGNSICSLKLLSGRKVTTTNEKKKHRTPGAGVRAKPRTIHPKGGVAPTESVFSGCFPK